MKLKTFHIILVLLVIVAVFFLFNKVSMYSGGDEPITCNCAKSGSATENNEMMMPEEETEEMMPEEEGMMPEEEDMMLGD